MDLHELDGEKVGDRIDAVVIKAGPDIRLSRKLAVARRAKAELRAAWETAIPVLGKVSPGTREASRSPSAAPAGRARSAPSPRSTSAVTTRPGLLQFVGQSFDFRVIEYAEEGRRVVVVARALLREALEQALGEIREKIVVGAVLTGHVRSITDFGAFVDLGGVDGLVHVTEISRRRVAHAKDVLTIGQEVTVKVTKVENEGKRISLSMKELEKDPWEGLARADPARHAFHEAGRAPRRVRPLRRDRAGHRRPRPRLPALPRASTSRTRRSRSARRSRAGSRDRRGAPPPLALAPRGLDVRPVGRARGEMPEGSVVAGRGRERRAVRRLRPARHRPHRPHPELRDGPPARDPGRQDLHLGPEGRGQGHRSRHAAAPHLPVGDRREGRGRARRDPEVPRGVGEAREGDRAVRTNFGASLLAALKNPKSKQKK